MTLRSRVRKLLHRIGLERVRTPGFADLIQREGITTVLDVGANVGQYAKELRLFGYTGRIVSFEPMQDAFRQLQEAAASDPRWDVRKLGLGTREGDAELNVSDLSVYNSFKPLSAFSRAKLTGARQSQQESVAVRRLDNVLNEEPDLAERAYLKIDTQGFEKEVMEGAGPWLNAFRAIQLELPLRALYEDQPLLIDMVRWLDDRGFEIAMAKENGFDREAVRLLELDVVFVPKSRD